MDFDILGCQLEVLRLFEVQPRWQMRGVLSMLREVFDRRWGYQGAIALYFYGGLLEPWETLRPFRFPDLLYDGAVLQVRMDVRFKIFYKGHHGMFFVELWGMELTVGVVQRFKEIYREQYNCDRGSCWFCAQARRHPHPNRPFFRFYIEGMEWSEDDVANLEYWDGRSETPTIFVEDSMFVYPEE